jgi:predicted alpha/beta hydrolase
MATLPGRRIRAVDDLPHGVVAQWKRWCSHPDFVVSEGEAVRQAYDSVKLPITAVVFTDDTMASPRGVRAMHSHYTGTQVDSKCCAPSSKACVLSGTSTSFTPRPGHVVGP